MPPNGWGSVAEPLVRVDDSVHHEGVATRRSRPRVGHLTTVDMSLVLLLGVELDADVEAGFEVIGISAPGPYLPWLREHDVTHVAVPALTRSWNPRADALAAVQLWRALRSLELDVLHTHTPKSGILGRVLGRLAGIPVVVNTCHGLWATPDDPWIKRAGVYAVEAFAARFSDAELYQNDVDRRTMRRCGVRRQQLVGNGTDLERFRPDPRLRAHVRAELEVGEETVLVGGVGRCVAEKGLHEFAAAARVLAGRARFVWVGPADQDKPDAVELGVTWGGVEMLGDRRDMEAIYAALDVFVLPSHREGFSRSGMEAAVSGCAMVVTDIRGCRELGRAEHDLLLVPPRRADLLGHAIQRLIEDPTLRRRLGAAARRRALDRFDQREVASRSMATYRSVAARKGLTW
jgi:glycosyltransferase involved in cell wall biosynthesis